MRELEPMMTMPGLRPKATLLLAALAAAATTIATPATAQFFFRPFIGWSAHRFEEPATELSPQEVVELLARRGFRLAQPPRYVDDVIVAIGVDRRGGHVRFVLDADDGEILERRRLDRGVAQAPEPHRLVEQKRPAPPRRAASKTPEPPPRAAATHPPTPVRPAAPHVPPSEATRTPAAPAAATTPAPAPKAPASGAAPPAPPPAAPEASATAPKPAAEWKAPRE